MFNWLKSLFKEEQEPTKGYTVVYIPATDEIATINPVVLPGLYRLSKKENDTDYQLYSIMTLKTFCIPIGNLE